MDVLWAPWRMEYILGDKPERCVFCVDPEAEKDELERRLVLYRGSCCLVMMNRFPYNNGHLLVSPTRHKAELEDLTVEELTELMKLTRAAVSILRKLLQPDGFNVGLNLGSIAGAGIDQHLHVHIVPRWSGDSNFMCVLGETRVIPEYLHTTFKKLEPHFRALGVEEAG